MIGKLSRLLSFQRSPTSPPVAHWRNLLTMFDRRGIDLVFDIGANEGQYAGYLRGAGYGGRIVSFEPLTAAHAALALNAAGDEAWAVAPRQALGAEAGEATINISNEADMSSLLPMTETTRRISPSSRTVGTEPVSVSTLDSVFGDYAGPDDRPFVKIDTQGFERAILDGAQDSMATIAGLQLELSLVPLYEGEEDWLSITELVGRFGFALHLVIPGYFSRHAGRMLQFDGVFFRPEQGDGGPDPL